METTATMPSLVDVRIKRILYLRESVAERVHDALPVLRRALRGGNVIRVRKIVGSELVFDPDVRAIRSVFFNSNIISKTKNCICVLLTALLREFCLQS